MDETDESERVNSDYSGDEFNECSYRNLLENVGKYLYQEQHRYKLIAALIERVEYLLR